MHRADANQTEIVAAWRKFGKLWLNTTQGNSPVDGFLLHSGIWLAIEIKNPKGRNTMTARQKEFHDIAKAYGGIIYVIRDMKDAMALIGVEA